MDGKRLKLLRERWGYTQESLAELTGVSLRSITRYERGNAEANDETVARLAKALNTSTDYLLGLTDDPNPPTAAGLSEKELAVITAWRRGERIEAMRVIANDE